VRDPARAVEWFGVGADGGSGRNPRLPWRSHKRSSSVRLVERRKHYWNSTVARKVQVHLLDDIDGAAADETVKFGLDDGSYEIDVCAKHADKVRKDLAKFIVNGRRVGRGGVTPTRRGRTAGPAARSDRAQNLAIREWAKRKKIQLSDRGRIPANVIEQFQAEAGR
jgi:hypothetical protein